MKKSPAEIIAAVATAPGRGGIGVVRVSGDSLADFSVSLIGKLPAARRAARATINHANGEPLDSGLAIYFPAPHSFTGDDVLEFHGHGGPVVLQMVLERCVELGARLAEPGEFSRRAFENGKIDLAQAEAVADLINAASRSAAKSAARSMQGALSMAVEAIVEQLINLRAYVESSLDFVDEEIDFLSDANIAAQLGKLRAQLAALTQRARQGKLLQSGLQVVLAGEPNVGKSSLLNYLIGDDLAIVTPHAGTTRDALRGSFEISGIPFHIIDTAGVRASACEIEQIGIERTWREIERADFALVMVDASAAKDDAGRAIIDRLPADLPYLIVANKIDLCAGKPGRSSDPSGVTTLAISAKSGAGIELLKEELLKIAGWQPAEDVFLARERHLVALQDAAEYLAGAAQQLAAPEVLADELCLAQEALGRISGQFVADDLLGVIFGKFCIGK